MEHASYTIELHKPEAKSRRFRAALVAYLSWSGFRFQNSSEARPLFLALAGSVGELRPFLANLRGGLSAAREKPTHCDVAACPAYLRLDFKDSHREQIQVGRTGDLMATVFAPAAFALDPAPGGDCKFLCLPTAEWLSRETAALAERGAAKPRELALARYVTAYLDRRTPVPIPPRPEFHRALYRSLAESEFLVSTPTRSITQFGLGGLGLADPIAVGVRGDQLEALLAELVMTHLPEEKTSHGPTRIAPGGWVLPVPGDPASGAGLRF
jgi:hypothetical protein